MTNKQDLQRLVAAYCDATIGEEDVCTLKSILLSSRESRQFFLRYCALCDELSEQALLVSERGRPLLEGAVAKTRWSRVRRVIPARHLSGRWVAVGLSLAFAAFVAGGYVLLKSAPNSPVRVTSGQAPERLPVANVVQGFQLEFGDGAQPIDGRIMAGRYDLQAGVLGLQFQNGVALTIEAPARFEIVSDMRIVVQIGRIWANVSKAGRGFVVSTPENDFQDLGTEFGIAIKDKGEAELHVFDGLVNVASRGTLIDHVEGGSGGIWQGARKRRALQPVEDAFTTTSQIGYRVWKQHRDEVRADPNVVLDFDFEALKGGVIRNRASSSDGTGDGTVRGCMVVSGRWADHKALMFEGTRDQVTFDLPGKYDAFAMTLWVSVSRLDSPIQAILNTQGFGLGEHHLQIGRDGSLHGSVGGVFKTVSSSSGAIQPSNGWTHIAAVLNRPEGQATYYIDGEVVAGVTWHSDSPLTFGPCVLGGFTNSKGEDGGRDFRGRIDEVVIYKKALLPSDIRELHRVGSGFHSVP